MAKPIKETAVFEGEDALAVLKEMQETPAQKDKEFAKKSENRKLYYSQNNIFAKLYFFICFTNLSKD